MNDNSLPYNVSKSGAALYNQIMATKLVLIACLLPAVCLAFMDETEIQSVQLRASGKQIGERIAFWAERFVGTPYDTDPAGEYVTKESLSADERVDCMYLVFRAVELAFGNSPEESASIALDKRFVHSGNVRDGRVLNYEDRFRYGEDMIESGKWGEEVTRGIGVTSSTAGSRGRPEIIFVSGREAAVNLSFFSSGDVVFFINSPSMRQKDEIVGHMGVIKRDGEKVYLIHAAGTKKRGGEVKKVLFSDYLNSMPFIGIRVSRFQDDGSEPERKLPAHK